MKRHELKPGQYFRYINDSRGNAVRPDTDLYFLRVAINPRHTQWEDDGRLVNLILEGERTGMLLLAIGEADVEVIDIISVDAITSSKKDSTFAFVDQVLEMTK